MFEKISAKGVKDRKVRWLLRFALWSATVAAIFCLQALPDTIGVFNAPEPRREAAKVRYEEKSEPTIVIPSVGVSSPIMFPPSTEHKSLKGALEEGVVHYPDSARPSEDGNTFIFGHSSAKLHEKNPARTAFTKLNQVVPGSKVEIWFAGRVYVYRVETVKILKPTEAEVYVSSPSRMLTLSTCWPVGDPANRFIVEAKFMRSYPQRSYVSDVGSSS